MNPFILAFYLLRLTGPEGQEIEVSPGQIVSLRVRREDEGHFHRGIRCLIHTTDGKFIGVTETCEIVREMMEDFDKEGK